MTTAKSIEYRIAQQLIQRREWEEKPRLTRLVDRVITVVAVMAGLFLLGSYLEELLWALLAAAAVLTLGTRAK